MITSELLDQVLIVLRKHNVMSACLETGGEKIAVTLGPEFGPPVDEVMVSDAPVPGGWKHEPSDPTDPDPLGLGTLDMAPADEPVVDVEETEL